MVVPPVVIVATNDNDERAIALARQLSLPLVPVHVALSPACIAYLHYRNDRLQLFPADAKQSGPVSVDFISGAITHRLQAGVELIVKAVKGRNKSELRVIDATAGLGRDSFVLAARGFDVTMIERNAIVAALLADGLRRAQESSIAAIVERMHLHRGDAMNFCATLLDEQRPDVIYLDPMFAATEKSALVKKDMRLFRQLLGETENDDIELLRCARVTARLRVVVKRASKAHCFAGVEPAYAVCGKAVRFDIYPV
jgi:16S rRNA (guanine1516-N2)-methyltransferase